jgi:hypothetical protein
VGLARVLVVVAVLASLVTACNSEGGWGFRNLGKRDASDVDRKQAAAR